MIDRRRRDGSRRLCGPPSCVSGRRLETAAVWPQRNGPNESPRRLERRRGGPSCCILRTYLDEGGFGENYAPELRSAAQHVLPPLSAANPQEGRRDFLRRRDQNDWVGWALWTESFRLIYHEH